MKTRRWIWRALLALALFGAGWWWCTRPAPLRLVGCYPTTHFDYLPCSVGFVVHESADTYVLRDWHGGVVWRRQVPQKPVGIWRAGSRITYLPASATISPDGKTFAVLSYPSPRVFSGDALPPTKDDAVCIMISPVDIWRGNTHISTTLHRFFVGKGSVVDLSWEVRSSDSGRVIAWSKNWPTEPVRIFDPGKQVQSIKLPSITQWGMVDIDIAPDGQYAVYDSKIYRLTGARDDLSFTPCPIIPSPLEHFSYFAEGITLSTDGTRYRFGTPVDAPAKDWAFGSVPAGARWTLLYRPGQTRIYSPVTGEAWTFPVSGQNDGGHAAGNGQYAVVLNEPGLPQRLQTWLDTRALPLVPHRVFETIYARPGRACARMGFPTAGQYILIRPPGQGTQVLCWSYLSPDGHALLNFMQAPGDTSKQSYWLYRW